MAPALRAFGSKTDLAPTFMPSVTKPAMWGTLEALRRPRIWGNRSRPRLGLNHCRNGHEQGSNGRGIMPTVALDSIAVSASDHNKHCAFFLYSSYTEYFPYFYTEHDVRSPNVKRPL